MVQRTRHCIHVPRVDVWNVRVPKFTSLFRTRVCVCVCLPAAAAPTAINSIEKRMYFLFRFVFFFFFLSFSQFPDEHAATVAAGEKTNRCLFQSPSHQSNCRCLSIRRKDFPCVCQTVDDSLVFSFGSSVCALCVQIVDRMWEKHKKIK